MRTIKFRGKTIDNGEWVYGYYVKLPHPLTAFLKDYIVISGFDDKRENGYQDFILVEPETVCQFTGLHDKNGVEIYEGDIVEFEYNNAKMIKEVYWDNEWNCWKVYINGGNIHTLNSHSMGYLIPTVIGNIHEGELK